MKKFLAALSLIAMSSTAMASTYTTVTVCNGGESGTECRKVTYKVRPPSKAEPVKCMVIAGEAGEVPCPTRYGVPKWLVRLNEAFANSGWVTGPVENTDYVGGP